MQLDKWVLEVPPVGSCEQVFPVHRFQNARREKLERMGEEILDLWQQLDIGKDEQVPPFGWMTSQTSLISTHPSEQKYYQYKAGNFVDGFPGAEKQLPKSAPVVELARGCVCFVRAPKGCLPSCVYRF